MSFATSREPATIGSSAAAKLLGVSHRTILNRVETGALVPLAKLDGKTGAYIFDRADVERLKGEDA